MSNVSEEPKKMSQKGIVREYAEAIFVALFVALFLRHFFVEAFKIPSASMVPTLLVGDHIFVNKFVFGTRIPFTTKKIRQGRVPNRGEIIVFIYPKDHTKDYIKRVVGLPGDKIEVKKDVVYVNDEEVKQVFTEKYLYADVNQSCEDYPYENHTELLGGVSHSILNDEGRYPTNFGPVYVEPDHLFVMGDNRDNSSDSRFWGQVPMNLVKGRALFIWLSLNSCGFGQGSAAEKAGNFATLKWLRLERFFKLLH